RVVVVAGGRLAGVAESSAVIGDDPVAGLEEGRRLLLPRTAVERVAVDEHDRLAGSVIFVVQLDGGAVLGSDGDGRHAHAPRGSKYLTRLVRCVGYNATIARSFQPV